MAGGVKTLDQGTKILQNVDVTSIVTALALGIAEAQERLDNNSVTQLIRLSETKVAGKSLLELGFQPAFYAFSYADVSASISLKIGVKEEVSFDLSLDVDYEKNGEFNKDSIEKTEKSRLNSIGKKAVSQRSFSSKANKSESLTLNDSTVEFHNEEGSYSKVEKTKEQIRDDSSGIMVDSSITNETIKFNEDVTDNIYLSEEDGYIVIAEQFTHTNVFGILKMDDDFSSSTVITLDQNNSSSITFDKENNFENTFNNAKTTNNVSSGTVFGFAKSGVYKNDWSNRKDYEFYFGWNKWDDDFAYSTSVKANSLDKESLRNLALLLKNDETLEIKIIGYTDGSGKSDYNNALGLKRANTIKQYLKKKAAGKDIDSQIKIDSKGEELAGTSDAKDQSIRKITIEFPNDKYYLIFDGGTIDDDAQPTSGNNLFVYLEQPNNNPSSYTSTFNYGSKTGIEVKEFTEKTIGEGSSNSQKIAGFYVEKHNDSLYLLSEDAVVDYHAFSNKKTEFEVKYDNQLIENVDKSDLSVYVSENKNKFSALKSITENIGKDDTLAISGSLDVRYARQFDVSVEGNASVSARMISLPPPSGLENLIQSITSNN